MLADSSSQSNEREKTIRNKDIEIFLILMSFINLKKINVEIAGDNGIWTFISHACQYRTNFISKPLNGSIVIIMFWGPIYVANGEFPFERLALNLYE